MKQEDSHITQTQPIGVEKIDQKPARRPILRTTGWKDIMICLAVGIASAAISSYLTIERVSPGLLDNDLSQAARMAEFMRNDWRKQYEDAVKERAALEQTLARLNAQVDKLAETIKRHETRLAIIQAQTPTYTAIKENLDHATETNHGLKRETDRILNELGVSHIRVLD